MNAKLFSKLVFLGCLLGLVLGGKAQTYEWAKGIIGLGGFNYEVNNAIAVDDSGNVYTIGIANNIVDFDPGVGVYNSVDGSIFISKLDSLGNFVWAKSINGLNVSSITLDDYGNVYITGTYEDTVDFDPGVGVYNLVAMGLSDMFITKLDAAGNFVWAKTMGGNPYNYCKGLDITVDNVGNVYITGYFVGICDFDPGIGVYNLYGDIFYSYRDIFISKLDASGNFAWAMSMEGYGDGDNDGISIKVDNFGNGYLSGNIQEDSVDFGNYYLYMGGFMAKFHTSSGYLIWAKNIFNLDMELNIDNIGNIYLTGVFGGTTDFDPGPGSYILTSAGQWDICILKFDGNGNFKWAKNMGGGGNDWIYDISIDNMGNIYTTGTFQYTADFNPGIGYYLLTSLGGDYDTFISKLDTNGNFIWAKCIGGTNKEWGKDVTIDNKENVYVSGLFNGTTDFDVPNAANLSTNDNLLDNIFVAKYNQCLLHSSQSQTACNSYTWNGNTYTTSGIYPFYTTTATGCDSSATLNLTIINPTAILSSTSPTICHSGASTITLNASAGTSNYTWQQSTNGGSSWYSVSGTNPTTTSIIATLNASRLFRIIYINDCGQQDTSPVFALNVVPDPTVTLTASNNNFCAGTTGTTLTATLNGGVGTGIYQWQQYNGTTWNNILGATNATYTTPVLSSITNYKVISSQTGLGCVTTGPNTINIIVKPLPNIYTIPNSATLLNGNSITLQAYNGTSYSWSPSIGLNTTIGSTIIANPNTTTTYAVTGLGTNGCSKTINVPIMVNYSTAVAEEHIQSMELYPNPANTKLGILLNTTSDQIFSFTIYDLLGKTLSQWQGKADKGIYEQEVLIENLSQGVYFLSVRIGERVMTEKFIKE